MCITMMTYWQGLTYFVSEPVINVVWKLVQGQRLSNISVNPNLYKTFLTLISPRSDISFV